MTCDVISERFGPWSSLFLLHNLTLMLYYAWYIYNISQSFTVILYITILVLIPITPKGEKIDPSLHLAYKMC